MERNRNTFVWIGFLGAIAVLAFMFRGQIYDAGGKLTVIPDQRNPDSIVFRWDGDIGPPMQTLIADAFSEWRDTKRRIVLSISSDGGLLTYGGEVIALLDRIKQTHQLDTIVERGSVCLSMCVPIYLQGQTRYASPESRWMFHEVSRVDVVDGSKAYSSRSEIAAATTRFINDFLRPAGVSERWLAELPTKMRARDYWLSGRRLFNDGAGVIQKLI